MNLISISLLIISLSGFSAKEGGASGVVVNFDRFVKYKKVEELAKDGTRFFLVLFSHNSESSQFLDNLEDINEELNKVDPSLNMYAMDLDLSENKPALSQWRIARLPAIYLFMGDLEPIFYKWEKKTEHIVNFYKKISTIAIDQIETTGDLKKLKSSTYAAVLFVVEEKPSENQVIYKIARQNYEISAGYTMKGSKLAKQFEKWINVYRNGKLKILDPPEQNSSEVEKFVKAQTHQEIFFFPEEALSLPVLFEYKFLFYLDDLAGITKATPWLKKLGDELRGDYVVLVCNNANSKINRTLIYFGVKKGDTARVRLTIGSEDLHYRLEESSSEPVNENTIKAWLKRYDEGNLHPFIKSQQLPEDWYKQSVKVLVGSNYEVVVNDTLKHVFVLLYERGSKYSDYALARFQELAEIYKRFDDLVIAKIDVNNNDIPHHYLRVRTIPAARFYPKGEKKELQYTGSPHLVDIQKFIEEQTGYIITEESQRIDAEKTQEVETEKVQEAEAGKAQSHEEF